MNARWKHINLLLQLWPDFCHDMTCFNEFIICLIWCAISIHRWAIMNFSFTVYCSFCNQTPCIDENASPLKDPLNPSLNKSFQTLSLQCLISEKVTCCYKFHFLFQILFLKGHSLVCKLIPLLLLLIFYCFTSWPFLYRSSITPLSPKTRADTFLI